MMHRVQKVTAEKRDAPHPSTRSHLAARSCRGCHQRKIRCDRAMPCTNCSRCGVTCVYPTKESDMARKGGPTLQSISNRLERLEVLLSRLAEDGQVTTRAAGGRRCETQIQAQLISSGDVNRIEVSNRYSSNEDPSPSTWELLLNEEEVVQYANNSLADDEDLVRNLQPTALETTYSHIQKNTKAYSTPHAPLDACKSSNFLDVLNFYPDTQLALRLWNVYIKSVDPVLKILHIPTIQSTIVATILDPKSAQSSVVALTYAIYFAAVTSLCHDDNQSIVLPCEKSLLLENYKRALDQLLMPTELMRRPEIESLQALAIYATCLRVHEVGRSVWVLNGLAIRLAQSIGLHRDGASLRLSPFDTEIRLRLWWHLCVLDSRAPEDQGFQPTVDIINRGLRLPLNVDDNQIYPGMTLLPAESRSWTEMSFFLIQTESCRLLHPILSIQEQYTANASLSIREKRDLLDEQGRILTAKYDMQAGDAAPTDLSRIAFQHTTTARKKMQFVLQLREEISMRNQKGVQDDTTSDVHKESFRLACDALECSRVLLKEDMTSGSGLQWFFKMYTQWYALAYVLRCLCGSPRGPETERAWTLVEELFPRGMNLDDEYGHGNIWSYLNLLRSQASSLRQHGQRRSSGSSEQFISAHSGLLDSKIPPSADTTTATAKTPLVAAHGTSSFPEEGQILITDPNETYNSFLDLSMPEFPFLPDWNAIINGCLMNDIPEIDTSFPGDYSTDAA